MEGPSLNDLQEEVFDLLAPYGNYLQRMRVSDGVQGINVDPGLWLLAGVAIGEFFKGLLGQFGKNTADLLGRIVTGFRGKQTEDDEKKIDTLFLAVMQDSSSIPITPELLTSKRPECLNNVVDLLHEAGLPSERANVVATEILDAIWKRLTANDREPDN
jgi:hypothetical protein